MKNYLIVMSFVPGCLFSYNEMQLTNLLKSISAGTPVIASGCDFRGAGNFFQQHQINFTRAQLSGTLFDVNNQNEIPTVGTVKIPGQATDLSGLNFSNAVLVSTSFKGANLSGAIFDGANIAYANFFAANLTGAKIDKAKNRSLANFDGATMPDGTIYVKNQ